MVKILFVEDSSIIMQEYLLKASNHGIEAVGAWDGVEALEVLGRGGIDVVVSDMCMPRMNGIDLLFAMKSKYQTIPFILASTLITEDLKYELDEFGAAGYFTKPVDFDQLLEKINQLGSRECL